MSESLDSMYMYGIGVVGPLVEVKVLVEEDHKDPLEVGDSGSVETCSIVPESVPHIGERGDNEMENGHSCEGGSKE